MLILTFYVYDKKYTTKSRKGCLLTTLQRGSWSYPFNHLNPLLTFLLGGVSIAGTKDLTICCPQQESEFSLIILKDLELGIDQINIIIYLSHFEYKSGFYIRDK